MPPASTGEEVSQASAREVTKAMGEKARSKGGSRKSPWEGGGGPCWAEALPSGWPTLSCAPCLAWSRQGLGSFQICFHFQFPLLLKPPQGHRKQIVILSRPQIPGLNCLPFANFSF